MELCRGAAPTLLCWDPGHASPDGTLRGGTQTLPFLVWVAWPAPAPAAGEVGLQGPPHTALAFPSLPPSFSGSLEIHQPPDIYYLLLPLMP